MSKKSFVENPRQIGKSLKDLPYEDLASKMASLLENEMIKAFSVQNTSTSTAPAKPDTSLAIDSIRKTADEPKNFTPGFIPELWSTKIFSKFYDSIVLPKITLPIPDPIRDITKEIKRLSESG
jgi:hypothetical protein